MFFEIRYIIKTQIPHLFHRSFSRCAASGSGFMPVFFREEQNSDILLVQYEISNQHALISEIEG